jgi:hypothetical protein
MKTGNKINAEGAIAIIETLKENTTLRELDFARIDPQKQKKQNKILTSNV